MLTVVDHPILRRDLTILRDRTTPHGRFRRTLGDVASILAYEASQRVCPTPLYEGLSEAFRERLAQRIETSPPA